ncbi:hypothetical protein PMSD_15000 [Paenibacillus macquariensis subsp. defensor]|nr:hypothetical protein PMSD_15000 [Paenibacillus macquariensis subsp. defensor]
MKLKSKISATPFFIIILICSLLVGAYVYNRDSISEKDINEFIEKENLKKVSVQKFSDEEYYIFSTPYIYVYRGPNEYNKSTASNRNNILFGGLQKGSIGLLINNYEVLKYSRTYSVVIDGKAREYEYKGEKYLIIRDYRIWNPTPQIKILFTDDRGEIIYETDY